MVWLLLFVFRNSPIILNKRPKHAQPPRSPARGSARKTPLPPPGRNPDQMLPRNQSAAAAAPAGPVSPENSGSPLSAPRRGVKSCSSGSLARCLVLCIRAPEPCRVSARSSSTTWKGRSPSRSSRGGEKSGKPARRK